MEHAARCSVVIGVVFGIVVVAVVVPRARAGAGVRSAVLLDKLSQASMLGLLVVDSLDPLAHLLVQPLRISLHLCVQFHERVSVGEVHGGRDVFRYCSGVRGARCGVEEC